MQLSCRVMRTKGSPRGVQSHIVCSSDARIAGVHLSILSRMRPGGFYSCCMQLRCRAANSKVLSRILGSKTASLSTIDMTWLVLTSSRVNGSSAEDTIGHATELMQE